MFRTIFLLTIFLLFFTGLKAQGIDYVHPQKASFQHASICTVFKIIGLKKDKGNKGPDNFYTRKKPLKRLYRKHRIMDDKFEGRAVYHFVPKEKTAQKHILYLHGGAYTSNFMKQHWLFISKLVRKKNVALTAPDYPLAPESDWKKNIAFVLNCYRNLLKTTASENIIFMGDSAGGGLSLALAMAVRDAGLPQPGQVIMLAPWLDLQMRNPEIEKLEKKDPMLNIADVTHSAMSYAVEEANLTEPYVSPIFGDINNLAPMSIFIGGRDVLKADTEKFRTNCKAARISINYFYYPKMMHVWMLASFFPESKKAFKQIGSLIESKSNSHEKR
jgi:acetyl esterase/lipase